MDFDVWTVRQRLLNGERQENLALELGVSSRTLRRRLAAARGDVLLPGEHGWTQQTIPLELIAQRLREGSSVRSLARQHGVSHTYLSQLLRAEGIELPKQPKGRCAGEDQSSALQPPERLPVEEVLEARRQGSSYRQLAERFGSSKSSMQRIVAAAGGAPGRTKSPLPKAVRSRYERDDVSLAQLAKELGVSRSTIRKRLIESGVLMRDQGRPAVITLPIPRIRSLRAAGMTWNQIGARLGVTAHRARTEAQRALTLLEADRLERQGVPLSVLAPSYGASRATLAKHLRDLRAGRWSGPLG